MNAFGQYKKVFDKQATNTTQLLDTTHFETAVVSITGNSTPDGTVKVYTVPNIVDYPSTSVLVATVATPTTTTQYVGPCNGGLLFELTGNSTGNVDVEVVLK